MQILYERSGRDSSADVRKTVKVSFKFELAEFMGPIFNYVRFLCPFEQVIEVNRPFIFYSAQDVMVLNPNDKG